MLKKTINHSFKIDYKKDKFFIAGIIFFACLGCLEVGAFIGEYNDQRRGAYLEHYFSEGVNEFLLAWLTFAVYKAYKLLSSLGNVVIILTAEKEGLEVKYDANHTINIKDHGEGK
jgi:hypothetical protein